MKILYVAKEIIIYKINQIFSKILLIMIVYMNELNLNGSLTFEVVFHVAKQEGGRGVGHILIYYEIIVSVGSRINSRSEDCSDTVS